MEFPKASTGIDPTAVLAMRDLELRARVVVDGLWSGLHRSPLHGFSVEFTEYRQYSPGDDLRYLDWKTLARSDRQYIKKFEDETNLRCHIIMDSSRSMNFTSGDYSKFKYASTLAATLAYFLLQQRDVVGLALLDSEIRNFIPARWRIGHLKRILAALDIEPMGRETQLGNALDQIASTCRKRGMLIILSDFLSQPSEWERQIGQLAAAGHDVRVIQILDPAEINLEFGKAAMWTDLESENHLYIDPQQAKHAYSERFGQHQQSVKKALESFGIRHQISTTNQPFDFALLNLLRQKPITRHGGRL